MSLKPAMTRDTSPPGGGEWKVLQLVNKSTATPPGQHPSNIERTSITALAVTSQQQQQPYHHTNVLEGPTLSVTGTTRYIRDLESVEAENPTGRWKLPDR